MEKLKAEFREYTDELFGKVEWTSLEELQASTVTVFVACILIAILTAVIDIAFKYGVGGIYDLF